MNYDDDDDDVAPTSVDLTSSQTNYVDMNDVFVQHNDFLNYTSLICETTFGLSSDSDSYSNANDVNNPRESINDDLIWLEQLTISERNY